MMTPGKILKTIRHVIEYAAVLVFVGIVKIVPVRFYPVCISFSATVAYLFTPTRVKIARENLRRVFPDSQSDKLKSIVKGVYRNLTANAFDAVNPGAAVARVDTSQVDSGKWQQFEKARADGRPIIFATAHYGAWEVLGQFLATKFAPINFLAKAQANARVDNLLNRLRLSFGGAIIPSQKAHRLLPKLFKRGECLVIVGDQDAGKEGVVVDFLGLPSSYGRGMALFSYHYQAPIAVVFLRRDQNHLKFFLSDIIEPDLSADKSTEIARILTRYSQLIGEVVKSHPDQWLWTHRRWKSTS